MAVALVTYTPEPEKITAFIARVSSNNQTKQEFIKLLKYCFKNNHWSIFEHVYITVEIVTTRAIGRELLRHRSFTFQEFSQRYSDKIEFLDIKPRKQDTKNRQNSHDTLSDEDIRFFDTWLHTCNTLADTYYREAINKGIAKESARFLLNENTQTKIYMTGNIRSWVHYLLVRLHKSTQLEHRLIADEIKEVLRTIIPNVIEFLEDKIKEDDIKESLYNKYLSDEGIN